MATNKRGRNRTPLQRVTCVAAINEGEPIDEVNRRLAKIGGRPLAPATYRSLKADYLPVLDAHPELLGEWVVHPMTWARLAKLAGIPRKSKARRKKP